jgi:hypothetical protein
MTECPAKPPERTILNKNSARLGVNFLMQCNAVGRLCMAIWLGINDAPDYGRAPLTEGLY